MDEEKIHKLEWHNSTKGHALYMDTNICMKDDREAPKPAIGDSLKCVCDEAFRTVDEAIEHLRDNQLNKLSNEWFEHES